MDFVSLHYFLSERQFENDLQTLRERIGEMPLMLEEFGLHTLAKPSVSCVISPTAPNCDDPHTETEQAAYYNALLSLGEAHGLAGYDYWTLTDFSYIVSGTQESHHCQGVLRNSLVNTCEVTITLDYAEKPAAETTRRHYGEHIAYLDLFDGWVDSNTDRPTAGWSDDWQEGGALLRGYNPTYSLWSHDLGKIAVSKFVTDSISITGTVLSPVLTDVNVSRYPILAGQVYGYSIRDADYGSDSLLLIGVKEGSSITPLSAIMPTATLPYTFAVDLRQPPLNWSGIHDFQIALELVTDTLHDGYSSAYEFDWISIQAPPQASTLLLRQQSA